MQPGPQMMRRVIAEIAGQDIVPAMHDIVRGGIFICLRTPRMVIISVPAGHHETDQHWDDEDRRRIERIDPNKRCQKRDVQPQHKQKGLANAGVLSAILDRADIAREGELPGIFIGRHHSPVGRAPGRLVFALIHIVIMMAEIVMQDPNIGDRAGLQSEHDLDQSIAKGRAEKRDMLVMMVPRRDTDFCRHRERCPSQHKRPGRDDREDQKIHRKQRQENRDRQAIFGKAKQRRTRRYICGRRFCGGAFV